VILVITGMDPFQFDRVVRPIDEWAGDGKLHDEVFIQLGSSRYVPKYSKFEKFLSFAAICEKIEQADVVITHAGAGSTLNCIHHGKHPIIVPRLVEHGEVIDNHQIPFAEHLDHAGVATMVMDPAKLLPAIESVREKRNVAQGSRAMGITRALDDIWRRLPSRGRGS
jgi:UDP-N-acetylglucosamine transferase subunit ALG13